MADYHVIVEFLSITSHSGLSLTAICVCSVNPFSSGLTNLAANGYVLMPGRTHLPSGMAPRLSFQLSLEN